MTPEKKRKIIKIGPKNNKYITPLSNLLVDALIDCNKKVDTGLIELNDDKSIICQ